VKGNLIRVKLSLAVVKTKQFNILLINYKDFFFQNKKS